MSLLDTPLRTSLNEQSVNLRGLLKEFERDFFATHSRRPGRDDIKQNEDVAAKYKQYNKIRDVLSGKLSKAALAEPGSPTRQRKRKLTADVSATPKRTRSAATPRKVLGQLRPDELDSYDAPSSLSPRRQITALGPTPQRDGRVMGIFDMLEGSGSTTRSSKKRKISALLTDELLAESPRRQGATNGGEGVADTAQTPARTRSKAGRGDLLDHLAGSPATARNNKHSRTPASEGRKFMLNQFFATPSAVRYASMLRDPGADELLDGPAMLNGTPNNKPAATPLLDRIMKRTPAKPTDDSNDQPEEGEKTPAYLKRSHSFKQRLLSASSAKVDAHNSSTSTQPTSPVRRRAGPRHLIKSKYNPRPLSQIARQIKDREAEEALHRSQTAERLAAEAAADDDELDAMREIEVNEDVLITDSQFRDFSHDGIDDNAVTENQQVDPPARPYKKKGQKRTTRRVIMRPSKVKTQEPRYRHDSPSPASSVSDDDDPDTGPTKPLSRVEETQLAPPNPTAGEDVSFSDDELLAEIFANSDDELFGVQKQPSVMKSPAPTSPRVRRAVPMAASDDADLDNVDANAKGSDGEADYDDDAAGSEGMAEEEEDDEDIYNDLGPPNPQLSAAKKGKQNNRPTTSPRPTAANPTSKPATAKSKSKSKSKSKTSNRTATTTTAATDEDDHLLLPSRKINPNLQSHQNFRSLKIRGKHGKTAGGRGRGRFGGGRGRR